MAERFLPFSAWLKQRLRRPAWRVALDPGFGCPTAAAGGCVFCRPESYRPAWRRPDWSLSEQLAAGAARQLARRPRAALVAYLQAGSGTWAPVERLSEALRQATAHPAVQALAIGTRPDCLPDPVVELLAAWSRRLLTWVELGVQSAHDSTLARLARGHDFAAVQSAAARLRAAGVLHAAHLILGLPGEDPAMEIETARQVAGLGPCGVKLHHLQIVRGTALAASWRRGQVPGLDAREYAARAAAVLERLPADTAVMRLCGDCPADLELAPRWRLRRGEMAELVEAALADRGRRQGSAYSPDGGGAAWSGPPSAG